MTSGSTDNRELIERGLYYSAMCAEEHLSKLVGGLADALEAAERQLAVGRMNFDETDKLCKSITNLLASERAKLAKAVKALEQIGLYVNTAAGREAADALAEIKEIP